MSDDKEKEHARAVKLMGAAWVNNVSSIPQADIVVKIHFTRSSKGQFKIGPFTMYRRIEKRHQVSDACTC